jgi:hypothetical protein
MSKYYWLLIVWSMCLVAGKVPAASTEPAWVARIHFAGGDAVAADPNAAGLKYLWDAPEGLALRDQTLDKLSHALDTWLRAQIAPDLAGPVALRPLLADLVNAEWQLELSQPGGGVEFILSVRLSGDRAQVWQTTLGPVVDAWKRTSPAHSGGLSRNRDWLRVELGNSAGTAPAAALSGLNGAWLTAYVDWTRLSQWFPGLARLGLPATQLQVAGRNGNFEATGNLFLSQPLPRLGNWQFPENAIRSPLIAFTAARGVSDWLKQQPWAASVGLDALPDQVFTWVMPQMPYQTYLAMPLANASAALPKIEQAMIPRLHDGTFNPILSQIGISLTNNQVLLTGLPFVGAYLQARPDVSGEILLAGLFPDITRGKPAPPEFKAALNQPNLVYYGWEVTSERMKLFPQMYQLLFFFTGHRQLDAASAGGKWLARITPALGPCVTTATELSPTELSFSRRAPAGLTSAELVAFVSWLEAPNFPGWDLRIQAPHGRAARGPLPRPASGRA